MNMLRIAVCMVAVGGVAAWFAGCSAARSVKAVPETPPVASGAREAVPAAPRPFQVGTIYFAYNESGVPSAHRDQLADAAEILLARSDVSVNVEGYCDERGTDEYNIDLGWKRAYAIRDYLKRMGIDDSRLYPISYGRTRPAVLGDTEAAWGRNRRAEIVERK